MSVQQQQGGGIPEPPETRQDALDLLTTTRVLTDAECREVVESARQIISFDRCMAPKSALQHRAACYALLAKELEVEISARLRANERAAELCREAERLRRDLARLTSTEEASS